MKRNLGPNGCIDIKMTFKKAPANAARTLQKTLSEAVRVPEGGTIHNFVYGVYDVKFTVKGQCYFEAENLENAARSAGFDLAVCECDELRTFDPAKDK